MYFFIYFMWFLLYLIRTDYADFSNYSPSVTNIIDFFSSFWLQPPETFFVIWIILPNRVNN